MSTRAHYWLERVRQRPAIRPLTVVHRPGVSVQHQVEAESRAARAVRWHRRNRQRRQWLYGMTVGVVQSDVRRWYEWPVGVLEAR